MKHRKIPFITLSEIKHRAWITISDCNFHCRGCFSNARKPTGKPLTVEELVKLLKESSLKYYGKLPEEIIITGGEPTLDKEYLIRLVSKLNFAHIILETNAYLLDKDYIQELVKKGVREFMVDLKTLDDKKHKWYTGYSNKKVLKNIKTIQENAKLIIKTLYIPGFIEEDEIKKIAKYIASINPQIEYRINDFKTRHGISRNPTIKEIEKAYKFAKKHLKNVVISRSCRRESKPPKKKTWITVFPDGTLKKRSTKNYQSYKRHLPQ
ncbi:MAG TPA: radical SAM protein [Methanothermobacter sp.]|nr:radical SAM domain protein [Methanothermobacter sp. MT-2]HHW04764.1 radical SAM protein [Methanothermobacter sp.]HOK72224.1 radical SAM protein [Methanothermobacter sp.]HOL68975.1 radical SAM protein [Methanothermobacter sp.]HPQ04886.1 radical SAM protein [Methanothermobacter sp.]